MAQLPHLSFPNQEKSLKIQFDTEAVESRITQGDGEVVSNTYSKMYRVDSTVFMAMSGSCYVYDHLKKFLKLALTGLPTLPPHPSLERAARFSQGIINDFVGSEIAPYMAALNLTHGNNVPKELVDELLQQFGLQVFFINENRVVQICLVPVPGIPWNHSIEEVHQTVSILGSGTPFVEGYCKKHKEALCRILAAGRYEDCMAFARNAIHQACLEDLFSGGTIHAVCI